MGSVLEVGGGVHARHIPPEVSGNIAALPECGRPLAARRLVLVRRNRIIHLTVFLKFAKIIHFLNQIISYYIFSGLAGFHNPRNYRFFRKRTSYIRFCVKVKTLKHENVELYE